VVLLIKELKDKCYIAQQAAYAASSVLCIPNRAVVQPRPQPKPVLTDFDLQP